MSDTPKTNVVLPGEQARGAPSPLPTPPPASVKLNLSKQGFAARRVARKSTPDPFQDVSDSGPERVKLLIWGPTATYKTRTALQFPNVVMIDLEQGARLYRKEFKFKTLPAPTPDEIMGAVRWLRDNRHDYRTLIIDPITIYWGMLQKKWNDIFLVQLKGRKAHFGEFIELSPREWNTIKSEFHELVRTCLQLDMNVVFVAHDTAQYEEQSGDFMRKVGERPDAEKRIERPFDMIVKTERLTGKDGRPEFWGMTQKDKTNKLPPRFRLESCYSLIASAIGVDSVERPSQNREPASEELLTRIQECVRVLNLNDAVIDSRLMAYGVSRWEDLSQEQAAGILERLAVAVDKQAERLAAQNRPEKDKEPAVPAEDNGSVSA